MDTLYLCTEEARQEKLRRRRERERQRRAEETTEDREQRLARRRERERALRAQRRATGEQVSTLIARIPCFLTH